MTRWCCTKKAAEALPFSTFEDATAYAALHVKGWPAWRVIGNFETLYFIELLPKGPWLTTTEHQ